MTKQEVASLLAVLRSVWTTKPIDEHTITAWSWALDDIAYPQAQTAVQAYLKQGSEFFPTPSQIRALIARDLIGPDLIAEAAWPEVLREVSRVGLNPLPVYTRDGMLPPPQRSFSHPLIAQAVDALGWASICLSEKPEITRAQFTKVLQALLDRQQSAVQRHGAAALAPSMPDALPMEATR